MMYDRLTKIIFNRLYKALSHTEIFYFGNNDVWFIDRAKKYWYLEYRAIDRTLYWRRSFFSTFFSPFSMDHSADYEPFILRYFELKMRYKSLHSDWREGYSDELIDEVMKYKLHWVEYDNYNTVNKILGGELFDEKTMVDMVINLNNIDAEQNLRGRKPTSIPLPPF